MSPGDMHDFNTARDFRQPTSVVVIAAGTGGPQALMEVLPRFQASYPGTIIVIQQMRAGFTRVLASHLNEACRLRVHEPIDGQDLRAAEVLMVPAGSLLTVAKNDPTIVRLDDIQDDPEARQSRTDQCMSAIAAAYGRESAGVLLTGLGNDGRMGMKTISDSGGTTIAQDEESSTVFDLPASAINAGVAHHVLPLWNIADKIISLAEGANANAA